MTHAIKRTTARILLAALVFFLCSSAALAVRLNANNESPQICERICSYERLGIRTYVDACTRGCTLYEKAYSASGDQNSALATCKAGCSSASRNICVYGCNAAKRGLP